MATTNDQLHSVLIIKEELEEIVDDDEDLFYEEPNNILYTSQDKEAYFVKSIKVEDVEPLDLMIKEKVLSIENEIFCIDPNIIKDNESIHYKKYKTNTMSTNEFNPKLQCNNKSAENKKVPIKYDNELHSPMRKIETMLNKSNKSTNNKNAIHFVPSECSLKDMEDRDSLRKVNSKPQCPTALDMNSLQKNVISKINEDANENTTDLSTRKELFKCNNCGKSFTQRGTLKQHVMIHTEEKPFKCNKCDKSFRLNFYLKTHAMTHTGEKPFKCDKCEKSFSQRGTLKQHAMIHTKEKPFKCDQCEKSFRLKFFLKTHSVTHTGEKPFKCVKCEKCFTQRGNLKQHAMSHTIQKPIKSNKKETNKFENCVKTQRGAAKKKRSKKS